MEQGFSLFGLRWVPRNSNNAEHAITGLCEGSQILLTAGSPKDSIREHLVIPRPRGVVPFSLPYPHTPDSIEWSIYRRLYFSTVWIAAQKPNCFLSRKCL